MSNAARLERRLQRVEEKLEADRPRWIEMLRPSDSSRVVPPPANAGKPIRTIVMRYDHDADLL